MKITKRIISLSLMLALLISCVGVSAIADGLGAGSVNNEAVCGIKSAPLYVSFGDSVAWGRLENEELYPEFDRDRDCYSGLLAAYLGADRVSYARRGMQTTDILYMIDNDFQEAVDSGILSPDSWWQAEYPPFDGITLEEVRENTRSADYITLCVGPCDVLTYPDAVRDYNERALEDTSGAKAALESYFLNGKMDLQAYNALMQIIKVGSQKAIIKLNYILDMIDGFEDYKEYYPRIVKDLRNMNPDGTIILIGEYIPAERLSFLQETPETCEIIPLINRLIDNINIAVKKAAVEYDCLYVDTMGIESINHPTVAGHRQIESRIVSVLNGDSTYSGNIKVTVNAFEYGKNFVQSRLDIFNTLKQILASDIVASFIANMRALLNRW